MGPTGADDDEDLQRFLRRVLVVAGVALLLAALWVMREALLIGFAAVLVAILLDAAAEPISRRTGPGRRWALLVAGLAILALVAGTVALIGREVVAQSQALYGQIPRLTEQFRERFGVTLPPPGELIPEGMLGSVASVGAGLVSAASALALAVVAGAYIVAQPERHKRGFLKLFPKSLAPRAEGFLDTAGSALRRWLLATLAAMAIVGTAVGLLAWALGLPPPLALGLFAALVEFIPLVGPILSAVPILLFAFAQGGGTVLWALAGVVLIQQIEGNAIQPLVGEALVDIPALVLLLGIVAFGALLGLGGVVLAAPIAVVAYVAAQKLWVRETLGRRVEVAGEE
jgi:predicted PurR-regulated permease PerM